MPHEKLQGHNQAPRAGGTLDLLLSELSEISLSAPKADGRLLAKRTPIVLSIGGFCAGSLDLERDGAERRAQFGTNRRNGSDDDNCDQSGDETVFDGRCAGFIVQKISYYLVHVSLHFVTPFVVQTAAVRDQPGQR